MSISYVDKDGDIHFRTDRSPNMSKPSEADREDAIRLLDGLDLYCPIDSRNTKEAKDDIARVAAEFARVREEAHIAGAKAALEKAAQRLLDMAKRRREANPVNPHDIVLCNAAQEIRALAQDLSWLGEK